MPPIVRLLPSSVRTSFQSAFGLNPECERKFKHIFCHICSAAAVPTQQFKVS